MDAGYSLRDAAAALNLSATDLLDASESAAQPLAALDGFSRQVAELQLLDSRMQALRALVKVCNDAADLEKKRLAAQAILRFDPWRAPSATGNGGRSNPPRSPRETRESSDDTAPPLPVPHTPRPLYNGDPPRTAPVAHAEAPALRQDRVPRLDRPPLLSTSPSCPTADKPCDESCTSAPGLAPAIAAASSPPIEQEAPAPRHAALATSHGPGRKTRDSGPRSPAQLSTCSPAQVTPAALAAAAGHAITVYALIPHSARAPPLRAAA